MIKKKHTHKHTKKQQTNLNFFKVLKMDKNTFIKLSEDYFNQFNDEIMKIYELFKEKK